MPKNKIRSIKHPFKNRFNNPSLWLVAAAVCLCPAAANALDPTDTATGTGALASENGGTRNTADGYNALHANTTGTNNTASGGYALYSNITGTYNTAGGYAALDQNVTGHYNTAGGAFALFYNTAGDDNTASGYAALYVNTTGKDNTASGAFALYNNTTGGYNTAGGYAALDSNITGNSNVALGHTALYASTKGSKNVAIGAGALKALTTGGGNIALGANAGSVITKGASNIDIGNPGLAATESDTIRIGDAQTRTFIAGIADAPMSGATVVIKSNGRLGVVASSARYKQDIKPLADTAGRLAQLRPVSYRYKAEPDATHYGLIAEEVDAVMPELVVRDDENRPESIQYQELIPLLLQQWKAQRARIARLEAKVEELSRSRLAAATPNR
jgi:hypothetical protein